MKKVNLCDLAVMQAPFFWISLYVVDLPPVSTLSTLEKLAAAKCQSNVYPPHLTEPWCGVGQATKSQSCTVIVQARGMREAAGSWMSHRFKPHALRLDQINGPVSFDVTEGNRLFLMGLRRTQECAEPSTNLMKETLIIMWLPNRQITIGRTP